MNIYLNTSKFSSVRIRWGMPSEWKLSLKILVSNRTWYFCHGQYTTFPATCIVDDTDYNGFDVAQEWNVATVALCQGKCQENVNCNYFSYNIDQKGCYLKSDFTVKAEVGFMAGPKYCPGVATTTSTTVATGTKKTIVNLDFLSKCFTRYGRDSPKRHIL